MIEWHVQRNPCDSGYKNKTVDEQEMVAYTLSLPLRKLRQEDDCEIKAIVVTKPNSSSFNPQCRWVPVGVLPQGSAASTPAPFMYREGQTVACGPQRVGPGLPSMWSSLGTNLPPETRKTLIYNGPHYR